MLNIGRDINSLSNFKHTTLEFVQRLKETDAPLVLTVNGVSELVVQSAESYQKLLDRLKYLEAVAEIKMGLSELSEGKARPALKALQTKLNISSA